MNHGAGLGLALGTAFAALGLTACAASGPSPVVAEVPLPPVPVVIPSSSVVLPSPSTTPSATTEQLTTTMDDDEVSADECDRIAMRSDLSNAELRPYLMSIGCHDAADGLLVGGAHDADTDATDGDPGEAALDSCTEQTGMTREECIADAAAGNAS